MRFVDLRLHDGSRHFISLPERVSGRELRNHIERLNGARITDAITESIMEAWIDFEYAGHSFAVYNHYAEWWFSVNDPNCPDETLGAVANHCAGLLGHATGGS